jgi:hypothetical protein
VVEASRQLSPAQALVPRITELAMLADLAANSSVVDVYEERASIWHHENLDPEIDPVVFLAFRDAAEAGGGMTVAQVRETTSLGRRVFNDSAIKLQAREFLDRNWVPTRRGRLILDPDYKPPIDPREAPEVVAALRPELAVEWSEPRLVAEWAMVFDVDRHTISAWFKSGNIRAKQVSRKYWQVDKREIPSSG